VGRPSRWFAIPVELGDPPDRPYENRYPSKTTIAAGSPLLYYAPIGGNNNKLPGLLFAANLHLKELQRAETVDMGARLICALL
jgi:hypothetical protein